MNLDYNKIKYLQDKLLKWFDENGRIFPWRSEGLSQYKLIIAEILLQRTKAETVGQFYSKFIEAYPNWGALEKAGIDSISEYLKPIGLHNQRARRLHNLAIEMLNRKGKLPKDRHDLEQIPFFGQYIANSIELLIFKQPSPLLDVNMARVLERYFGQRKMADIRYDPYLQQLAKAVVNVPRPKDLNWAILDYAAIVCKVSKPQCDSCVLNAKCLYYVSRLNC